MKRELIEQYIQLHRIDIPKARTEIDKLVAAENEMKKEANEIERQIKTAREKGEVKIWTAIGYHVMVDESSVRIVKEGALD